ncbi:hypothetical protein ACET3Z_021634 [Daucus carota]
MKGRFRELKNGVPDDDGSPVYEVVNDLGNDFEHLYTVGPRFYSLKIHYGGDFDESFETYNGGKYTYVDYIPRKEQNIVVLDEIMQELGLEKGFYSIWYHLPQTRLHNTNMMLLETDGDVEHFDAMLVSYSHICTLYVTVTNLSFQEFQDFSFTQFELDERERRVGEMREEVEKSEPKDADGACEKKDADEPNSFIADTSNLDISNLDSTESEAPPVAKKRKRRIPPPNPPYRTRKKGSIKGTTHGGTARPFKPPAKVGPLGVEASSVGKKKTFTSLRNLEKAAVIRKNGLGKKD